MLDASKTSFVTLLVFTAFVFAAMIWINQPFEKIDDPAFAHYEVNIQADIIGYRDNENIDSGKKDNSVNKTTSKKEERVKSHRIADACIIGAQKAGTGTFAIFTLGKNLP